MIVFLEHPIALLATTIVTGLCYGGIQAVIPYTIFSYYGQSRFGFLYSFLHVFSASNGFILSLVSGRLYDYFSQDRTEAGDVVCYGTMCYIFTLCITTCCLIIATALAVWLFVRERRHDEMKSRRGPLLGLINA